MVSITPRAVEQVRAWMAEHDGEGLGLRLQVVGGGCSGFLYDLALTDAPEPSDQTIQSGGLTLLVDGRAASILEGTVIDYGDSEWGEGFLFSNPSARKTCSCGASFST